VTATPEAVRNLEAVPDNDNLVITWNNPVDYEGVDVDVVDPDGKRLDAKRVSGFATRSGPARVVVLNVRPGPYKVKVYAAVKSTDAGTRRASREVVCHVPESVSGGYVTRRDLAMDRKEPLDVVFFIHPDSSYAAGKKAAKPVAQLFRQMAAGVLSEAFLTALQVPGEQGLKRIEDYRERVSTDIEPANWPLDPDALIIVDVRAPSREMRGQLCVRILDLKLAEALGKATDRLDRELYNRRALVVEEYERFADLSREEDLGEALRVFRDAWRGVLNQVLVNPRYLYYVERLAAYKRDRKPDAVRDKEALQAFMFNVLPAEKRPYDEEEQDADKAAAVFKKRASDLEREVLFGPGIGGPLVKPPPREPRPAPSNRAEKEPGKGSDAKPAEGRPGPEKTSAKKEPEK